MTGQHDPHEERLRQWLGAAHAGDELWRAAVDAGLHESQGARQRTRSVPRWEPIHWRWMLPVAAAGAVLVLVLVLVLGGVPGRIVPGVSPGAILPPAQRLDRHIAASAPAPVAEPVGARIAGGELWVVTLGASAYQMDPVTGQVEREVTLPGGACGPLTAAGGLLWLRVCPSGPVAEGSGTQLVAIDPVAGDIKLTLPFATRAGVSVAELDGSVWAIADERSGTVVPVDPANGELGTPIALETPITDIAAAADVLWLAAPGTDGVLRLDPAASGAPEHLGLGDRPTRLLATRDAVWVGLAGGELVRLAPRDGSMTARLDTGADTPTEMVATSGRVIVLSRAEIAFVDVASTSVVRRIDVGSHAIVFPPQFEGPNHGLAADGSTVWFVPPRGHIVRLSP